MTEPYIDALVPPHNAGVITNDETSPAAQTYAMMPDAPEGAFEPITTPGKSNIVDAIRIDWERPGGSSLRNINRIREENRAQYGDEMKAKINAMSAPKETEPVEGMPPPLAFFMQNEVAPAKPKMNDQEVRQSEVWQNAAPEVKAALTVPDEGWSPEALALHVDKKTKELGLDKAKKDLDLSLGEELIAGGISGMGKMLTDPVDWAVNMAIPGELIVGRAFPAAAKWASEISSPILKKLTERSLAGAAEGLLGQLAVEPLEYSAAQMEQANYNAVDSLVNVAFAPLVGAAMHNTLGAIGDLANIGRAEKAQMIKSMISKILNNEDGSINIFHILENEVEPGSGRRLADTMLRQVDTFEIKDQIGYLETLKGQTPLDVNNPESISYHSKIDNLIGMLKEEDTIGQSGISLDEHIARTKAAIEQHTAEYDAAVKSGATTATDRATLLKTEQRYLKDLETKKALMKSTQEQLDTATKAAKKTEEEFGHLMDGQEHEVPSGTRLPAGFSTVGELGAATVRVRWDGDPGVKLFTNNLKEELRDIASIESKLKSTQDSLAKAGDVDLDSINSKVEFYNSRLVDLEMKKAAVEESLKAPIREKEKEEIDAKAAENEKEEHQRLKQEHDDMMAADGEDTIHDAKLDDEQGAPHFDDSEEQIYTKASDERINYGNMDEPPPAEGDYIVAHAGPIDPDRIVYGDTVVEGTVDTTAPKQKQNASTSKEKTATVLKKIITRVDVFVQNLFDTLPGFKEVYDRLLQRQHDNLSALKATDDSITSIRNRINLPKEADFALTKRAIGDLKNINEQMKTEVIAALDKIFETKKPTTQAEFDVLKDKIYTSDVLLPEQKTELFSKVAEFFKKRDMSSLERDAVKAQIRELGRQHALDTELTRGMIEYGMFSQGKQNFIKPNEEFIRNIMEGLNSTRSEGTKFTESEVRATLNKLREASILEYANLKSKNPTAGAEMDAKLWSAAVHLGAEQVLLKKSETVNKHAEAIVKFFQKKDDIRTFIQSYKDANPDFSFADAAAAYYATDPVVFRKINKDFRHSVELAQEYHSTRLVNGVLDKLKNDKDYGDLTRYLLPQEGLWHLRGDFVDLIGAMGMERLSDKLGIDSAVVKGKKISPEQMEQDIVREGIAMGKNKKPATDNPIARRIAEILKNQLDYSRLKRNALGANIEYLAERFGAQTHDPDKIVGASWQRRASKTEKELTKKIQDNKAIWKEDAKKWFDAERTFKGKSADEWLDAMFENIQKGTDSFYGSESQITDIRLRESLPRKVFFKDAESFLAYNKKYGKGSVIQTILTELDWAGKDIGIMEKMGGDHQKMHEEIKKMVSKDASLGAVEQLRGGEISKLDNLYGEISGESSKIKNPALAWASSYTRKLADIAYLGGVIFSVAGDLPNMNAMLRRQGQSFFTRYVDTYIRGGLGTALGIIPGMDINHSQKNVLKAMELGLDVMLNQQSNRFSLMENNDKVSRVHNRFFMLNLLQDYDVRVKTATAVSLSNYITNFADKSWAEIAEIPNFLGKYITSFGRTKPWELAKELSTYGIGEREWNIIREYGMSDIEGNRFISPAALERAAAAGKQEIDANKLERFRAFGIEKEKTTAPTQEELQSVAEKLGMYFYDQVRTAIPTPGVRQRTILHQGLERGTVKGELMYSAMQFKSFLVTSALRGIAREGGGMSGAAKYASLVAVPMILVSGLNNIISDYVKGQDGLANLSNQGIGGFLGRALTRAFGFKIISDAASGSLEKIPKDVSDIFSGIGLAAPGFGLAKDVVVPLAKVAIEQSKPVPNKESRAELFEATRKLSPLLLAKYPFATAIPSAVLNLSNIHGAKTLLEYLAMDAMNDYLSPGYTTKHKLQDMMKNKTRYLNTSSPKFGGGLSFDNPIEYFKSLQDKDTTPDQKFYKDLPSFK